MTRYEFSKMELTLSQAGMPTYTELLKTIVDIIDPPDHAEIQGRVQYLRTQVLSAQAAVKRAADIVRMEELNETLRLKRSSGDK